MEASDSLSRTLGMDFFIPFPFPNFGNWIFSFPSHSQNLGMDLFIPFPFPNFGNGLFQFPSHSRTLKSHSRSPLIHINHKNVTHRCNIKELGLVKEKAESLWTIFFDQFKSMLRYTGSMLWPFRGIFLRGKFKRLRLLVTEGPIDPTSTQSFPTVGPRDSGDKIKTEIQNTKIEMLKTKYKMKWKQN